MNNFYYVYRITYLPQGKHYVGSRKSQGLPPQSDLGKRYFTSSKAVSLLFKTEPHNFKTKIIRLFDTRLEALAFERQVHLRCAVVKNPKFFNRVVAGERFVGIPKTDTQKKWLSEHTSARRPEVREKMRLAKLVNPTRYWLGKQRSPETIEKLRQASTGTRPTAESCAKRRREGSANHFFGHKHTDTSRQKMSESAKRRWGHA